MQKLSNQILDLREIEELAKNLCKDISSGDIYLFQGELGAGKTTLVRLLINNLYSSNNLPKPASIASSPIASAVKHASSEGFKTQALPIAREAPKVRPMICIG